jgi:hypothetical protein
MAEVSQDVIIHSLQGTWPGRQVSYSSLRMPYCDIKHCVREHITMVPNMMRLTGRRAQS